METEYMKLQHRGEEITIEVEPATNSNYRAGFRFGKKTERGHVVLLDGRDVVVHRRASEPRSIGISNTGRAVFADWIKYGESTGAEITVFDTENTVLYEKQIEGSAPIVDISEDGSYIVICPYTGQAHIERVDTQETVAVHEYDVADRLIPRFTTHNGEPHIEFSFKSDSDPLYRIDTTGNITWQSKHFEDQQYYQVVSLDESVNWQPMIEKCAADYQAASEDELRSQIANTIGDARLVDASPTKLEEVVTALEEYRDVFTREAAHSRLIAQTLGDAYYRLAREQVSGGELSELWELLQKSGDAYRTVLPWYQGKQGLAKVLGLQGKQYRKLQRPTEAMDCYKQIRALEEQFDVDLLTEADEKHLAKYERQGLNSTEPAETGRMVENLYMYT